MAVKVGINGFGRIGRNVFRTALANPEIDFVAVNDLTTPATLAHLLKYDSILGNLKNDIQHGADFISVDGKKIKVFAERDPAKLDWASVGAEIVVESTGLFTDATKAKAHLGSTVKKVIISAPATNEDITSTTPPRTTSSPTRAAPPTASHPSSRSSTTPSASSPAS
jgi:glyceraldehyde 3-phosphate dehydrogenase